MAAAGAVGWRVSLCHLVMLYLNDLCHDIRRHGTIPETEFV